MTGRIGIGGWDALSDQVGKIRPIECRPNSSGRNDVGGGGRDVVGFSGDNNLSGICRDFGKK